MYQMVQFKRVYSSSFSDLLICKSEMRVLTWCKQSTRVNPKTKLKPEKDDRPTLGWSQSVKVNK